MGKKFFILGTVVLLICIALFIFNILNYGKVNNATISIGESEKFSTSEIQEAVNCVLKEFRKYYDKCNLIKLWYDEEKSDCEIESYMSSGKGHINGIKKENVIVLFSDFHVGSIRENKGNIYPDTDECGWSWILVRDDKNCRWRIDDRGY